MKSIKIIAVIFATVAYCVFEYPPLFAQNNQFNNNVATPQDKTHYLGSQYTVTPHLYPTQYNANVQIEPTVYQPAFSGNSNSNNNNISHAVHLSNTYSPGSEQTTSAKTLPTNNIPTPIPLNHNYNPTQQTIPQNNTNNIPYSPFPTPKPIYTTTTPPPFPNPNNHELNQHQLPYHNNTTNNSAITTVGFVTPALNSSPTEPKLSTTSTPFTTPVVTARPYQLEQTTINNPHTLVRTPIANNPADNNSAAFAKNPVVNNNATNNPIANSYKLQHLTGAGFETKLIKKLGQRFIPVHNIENSQDITKYRLPVKNGSNIDLTIDRTNGIVIVSGANTAVENCVKIVRLLDLPESKDGSITEFKILQNTDSATLRKTVGVINQSSGNQLSGQNTVKLVQNQPSVPTPPAPQPPITNPAAPEARFNLNPTTNNNQTTNKETTTNPDNTPAAEENNGNGTILGPVQVNIIEGLDIGVIMGQPNDVAIVQRIIDQIDKISLEYEPVIELVPIKQADSLRVCQIVQELYQQIYASRRGTIIMLPLVKPNTILIVGKKENLNTAKELISKLDLAVDPKSQFRIFRLKNAQAETLIVQIQTFYQTRTSTGYLEQQVNVVADARTNSLIVQANPRDLKEIETMINQLDVKGGEAKNIVKTFPLKNAVASELATTLQNIITGNATNTGNFGNNNTTASTQSRNPVWVIIDKDKKETQSISTLYDIRITADTRLNMLIVSAPPDTMVMIEMLVNQLDQLPSAEAVIKIFTLVNADAYAITTMLQNLFSSTSTTGTGFGGNTGTTNSSMMPIKRPGIEQNESSLVSVRFVAEVRTNSILAIGSAGDMATVETILMRLDEENMNNRKIMTIKLINTPASEIAPVIQQYVTNERQLEIQNITSYLPQSPKEQYLKEIVIVAEPISNTLIISCTPRFYDQIRNIVKWIDERPRVVAIKGLIAEVKINNGNERGFEIGLQDSILFKRSTGSPPLPGFLFGSDASLPTGNVSAGTVATQGISQLGTRSSNGIGGFTFSASSESVSILMRALEEKDKLKILSTPQLTTLHNMRAVVDSGQEIPFLSSTSSTYGEQNYGIEWKNVGTSLDVTPRITADDQIVMSLYIGRSSLGSKADTLTTFVNAGGTVETPKINHEKVQTTISAMDGQTVIIGGLISEQKEFVNRSIPVLNKIPVIKHFFEYESQKINRSELLIILTATIIRSDADMDKLKQQEYSRLHWCLSDVVKLTGKSEMKTRTDHWLPNEVPYIKGTPTKLQESQLPPEEDIKKLIPIKVREE
ncbi:MAG: hypothetical protein LBC74_06470 [Planctomycetaceae bacterium]|jgi:type II secretory pathway component GspD/PulD (secretin)|nr:hypothetical protein [Planctomycetaceae bacterium]